MTSLLGSLLGQSRVYVTLGRQHLLPPWLVGGWGPPPPARAPHAPRWWCRPLARAKGEGGRGQGQHQPAPPARQPARAHDLTATDADVAHSVLLVLVLSTTLPMS